MKNVLNKNAGVRVKPLTQYCKNLGYPGSQNYSRFSSANEISL